MPTSMSQSTRSAQLITPYGDGVLNAVRFDGVEGLSELFEYTIEAAAEKALIDFDPVIGECCVLVINGKTGDPRRFSGMLTDVRWLGVANEFYLYRLTLRPWLWLLSRTADCRIFHQKNIPAIIREVFTDRGFQDFDFRLTESYESREYTVQYRETDLDFVLRLMQEVGIYYYFEHRDRQHILVLVDAKSAHQPLPAAPAVIYEPRLISGRSDKETIYEISSARHFQFGKVTLNDYDYLKPTTRMLREYTKPAPHSRGAFEIYDYPGRYVEPDVGEKLARVILEAEHATDQRRNAIGDVVHLCPGGLTRLGNHPEPSMNIEYLVVRCTHSFEEQSYRSVAAVQEGEPYTGSYELQPADVVFRAPRVTRRPSVLGPQTARVIGGEGEEVDVDEYGRILVQFHWDRRLDGSRRVRIAQTWAGKTWGSVVIPRVGMEVVVEYLEGDPDQPLVTGCVYNADMMPPYALAANKTRTGIKSNSSKGGNGYNEFGFEDKKGEEYIQLHAEKDYNLTVLNTETRDIAERFAASGASRTTVLHKGDDKLDVSAGSQTVNVAMDQTISVGKTITIEADVQIEIKCGGSKIVMTPTQITIEAGGVLDIKAPGKASVDGGAMMTLKAGIININ